VLLRRAAFSQRRPALLQRRRVVRGQLPCSRVRARPCGQAGLSRLAVPGEHVILDIADQLIQAAASFGNTLRGGLRPALAAARPEKGRSEVSVS